MAKGKPDDSVATIMVQAYSQAGLNEPENAVRAQEITEERPKDSTFAGLAVLAYQAGQTRKGDLATQRALDLADKDDRNTLKSELEAAKQQAFTSQLEDATQAPTATPEPAAAPATRRRTTRPRTSDASLEWCVARRPCSSTGRAADS